MQSETDIRLHRLYTINDGYAIVIADVTKRNVLDLVSLDVSRVLQQKNVCEFRS
jgi:hypothetical protein